MAGDTEVQQYAPSVVDDEEDVEHTERGGGDREEVDRGDGLAVVGEKGAPSLPCVGISRAPGHKARDRAFGDLKTELLDLAVDARRSPRSRPAAAQGQPEDPIGQADARSRVLPSEDGKLLSEREVLEDQVGPAGEDREESPGDGKSAVEHPRTMMAVGTEGNRARLRAIRVSCTGTQLVEGQGGRGIGEGQHVLGHFPARERTRTLVSECGDAADAVLTDSGPDWSPVPPISSVSRSACPTGRARPSGRSAGPGSSGGRRASSVVRQRCHRRPARRRRSPPCTCPRCRSAA